MSIIVQIRESSGQLVQGLALGTCGQLVAGMWISPGTYFLWGDGQRTRGQQNTADHCRSRGQEITLLCVLPKGVGSSAAIAFL